MQDRYHKEKIIVIGKELTPAVGLNTAACKNLDVFFIHCYHHMLKFLKGFNELMFKLHDIFYEFALFPSDYPDLSP